MRVRAAVGNGGFDSGDGVAALRTVFATAYGLVVG
jgi:hypothetical protein